MLVAVCGMLLEACWLLAYLNTITTCTALLVSVLCWGPLPMGFYVSPFPMGHCVWFQVGRFSCLVRKLVSCSAFGLHACFSSSSSRTSHINLKKIQQVTWRCWSSPQVCLYILHFVQVFIVAWKRNRGYLRGGRYQAVTCFSLWTSCCWD